MSMTAVLGVGARSGAPAIETQSIDIKAVESNDFDIWLSLWKGYQQFYEVDIAESVALKTWARFLDPTEPMHAALAMVGEQAVGLVHAIYHRAGWTTSDDCYLQDLFVVAGAGRKTANEHRHSLAPRRCHRRFQLDPAAGGKDRHPRSSVKTWGE